jgi:hypothetical protein
MLERPHDTIPITRLVLRKEFEMADYAAPAARDEPTGSAMWALGFLFFATPVMVMAGAFQFCEGLATIIKGGFYITPPNYAYHLDPAVWGWIHLLFGILMMATGVFLALGRPWARLVGIIVLLVSAIAHFFSIPYYPVWSLLIIALDVLAIWAVIVYGRDLEKLMS